MHTYIHTTYMYIYILYIQYIHIYKYTYVGFDVVIACSASSQCKSSQGGAEFLTDDILDAAGAGMGRVRGGVIDQVVAGLRCFLVFVVSPPSPPHTHTHKHIHASRAVVTANDGTMIGYRYLFVTQIAQGYRK